MIARSKPTQPSQPINIIVDTREQTPWVFKGPNITTTSRKLDCGDYSIDGYEDRICIERKSKSDAISTIIHNRRRFYSELSLMRDITAAGGLAVVVVEGSLTDMISPDVRRGASAESIIGSLAAIHSIFNVPILFCGGRAEATAYAFALMLSFKRKLDG